MPAKIQPWVPFETCQACNDERCNSRVSAALGVVSQAQVTSSVVEGWGQAMIELFDWFGVRMFRWVKACYLYWSGHERFRTVLALSQF